MRTSAKRALSALATVSVLTVTVFGIVGLTAVPVSALEWNTAQLSGSTMSHVGDTLTYTAQVNHCTGASRVVTPDWCGNAEGMTVIIQLSSTSSILAQRQLVTDSNGQASTSFTFTEHGVYKVFLTMSGARVDDITVTIFPQASPTLPPPEATPAAKGAAPAPTDGGGQPTEGASSQTTVAGDAEPTKTTSASVVGDERATTQSTPGAGIAVVLLAIIATAFLMRRRD